MRNREPDSLRWAALTLGALCALSALALVGVVAHAATRARPSAGEARRAAALLGGGLTIDVGARHPGVPLVHVAGLPALIPSLGAEASR